MPRERDPMWKHVDRLGSNGWICHFCGQEFRGGITRLKAHIAGLVRYGIKGCEKVSVNVQAEAREGLMPKRVMSLSNKGVSKDRIQGNVRAASTSASHLPNVEGGINLTFPQGEPPLIAESHELPEQIMQEVRTADITEFIWDNATGHPSASPPPNSFFLNSSAHTIGPLQIPEHITTITSEGMPKGAPAGASSSQDDQTAVPHSNEPLPSCNEESVTKTSSFSLQKPMDICTSTRTYVDLQDLDGGANMANPSSSQVQPALVSPQHRSNHETKNVKQNPTVTSQPDTGNNFEENRALKGKVEPLFSKEAGLRDELEFVESLSPKKQRMEVANWLADVEKLRNYHNIVASEDCFPPHQQLDILMQEVEDFRRRGKLIFDAKEIKFSKFLEGKMVGEAFQRNSTKILEYLVGNRVSRLGIIGMGGVGKTTIMKHVHDRLLEEATYGNVLWITMSQDFNTKKLQDDIWEALCLGTLQEKDVKKRAAMLSYCLTQRGKFTIILDDVWKYVDLEEVGIPIRADEIKLVLTTRSFDVCRQMQCQDMIKIEPLSQIEAESLFWEELGPKVAFNLKITAIVHSLVKECGGLPLGVITMARSMRGVTDEFQWRDSLVKLEESCKGQTDMEKVLMNLKCSYDHLSNPDVQQCFLSCALYPKDKLIDKYELIEFFIDQGLISRLNTRNKQYDRGFTILSKLINVCLLENHGRMIKMHNLIRDMALHIMSATSIVKAGEGLMGIPEEYWTDALEKVSVMENHIKEFPLNMSLNCPKLSTCLLNRSLLGNVVIPDSFFKQLCGLKVLNLGGCELRKLPDSISDLVNLRALLLRECRELRCLPFLGKLISLRKLDICGCVHLEALEGLEMLVNLRFLDLTDTRIKRLAKGTLGDLLNLQFLKVQAVNGDDLAKLRALERLQCHFYHVDDFNKLVRVIEQTNICYYRLKMDQEESLFHEEAGDDAQFGEWRIVHIHKCSHAIVSTGGESSGNCILIPRGVQTLIGTECDSITNLSSMGPLEHLESLNIEEWKSLGVLLGGQDEEITNIHGSPAPTPTPFPFPSLRVLKISRCPKLKYLFGLGSKFCLPNLQEIKLCACEEMVGIIAAVTPIPLLAFPSLVEIYVEQCDKMKRLVESEWLPHFPNLRSLSVHCCANMEEIIKCPLPYIFNGWKNMEKMIGSVEQGQNESIVTHIFNTPSSFESSISLPALEVLSLQDLPQLKSICRVPITCNSMKNLHVYKCPELKRIPLELPLRDNNDLPSVTVEDEEQWKTLMWDHPNAQSMLRPYLHFLGGTCVLQRDKSHSH